MKRTLWLVLSLGCSTPSELSPSGKPPPVPAAEPQPAQTATRLERSPPETISRTDPFPEPPPPEFEDKAHRGASFVEALTTLGDDAFEQNPARALAYWRWASVGRVARLHRADFRHPVGAQIMERNALASRVRLELAKEYTPASLSADASTLYRFGFTEALADLGQTYVSMLTEEIAGFYDPDTKELYLIAEPAKKSAGWLDFLGSSGGADEQKLVLDHEVCHALQDQRFNLFAMQATAKSDDDAMLALSALIEGDATVVMMLAMMGESEQEDLLAVDARIFDATMSLVLPFATAFASGDAFQKAPRIVRESLLAPYVRGLGFALRLWQARTDDADAVGDAFRSPPRSSEQILHPERYLGDSRDEPQRIQLGDAPGTLAGRPVIKENCLGEFALSILFEDHLGIAVARDASAGWDGDTYRVYAGAGGPDTVVWSSIWDTPDDAAAFERAVAALYGKTGPTHRTVAARRSGDRVAVVIDPPPDADVLLTWLLDAKVEPKRFPTATSEPSRPFPADPSPAVTAFMRRVRGGQ